MSATSAQGMRRTLASFILPAMLVAITMLLMACGGATASRNTSAASSAAEQFAYVASPNGNVYVYDSKPEDGTFQRVGAPVPVGIDSPSHIFLDRQYQRLFVINDNNFVQETGNNVSVLQLNSPSSPQLAKTQALAGVSIHALLFDNVGLMPLVIADVGAFETARFDPTTNSLQDTSFSQQGEIVLLHPSQRLVISITHDSSVAGRSLLQSFARDPNTGALTSTGHLLYLNGVSFPGPAALSPDGTYVVFPDLETGAIYTYSIGADGNLSFAASTAGNAGAGFVGFLGTGYILGYNLSSTTNVLQL